MNSFSGLWAFIKIHGVNLVAKVYVISMTFSLALTWFTAFFNGYTILISINRYNEAYPELFMWVAGTPFILLWLHSEWKNLNQEIYTFKKQYRKKYNAFEPEEL